MILTVLDLLGTFVFAITGAFRAVKYELDVLGVLILAVMTGVGGGLVRDVLIGHTPPAAFENELYLIVSLVGGLLVFFLAPVIAKKWPWVKIGDAIGLSVFAIIGAAKGFSAQLGPIGVIFTATVTATGGGVIRDLMVREIPTVIRTDFYATAAALGGGLYYLLTLVDLPEEIRLLICGLAVLTIRLVAMKWKIVLPKARVLPAEPAEIARQEGLKNSLKKY